MEAPALFAVWLALMAFWIASLIDAGRWSSRQWAKIGRPKGVWMGGLAITGIDGTNGAPQTLSGEL